VPGRSRGRNDAVGCRVVDMPSFRPYSLKPGQRLEVEVVQPDAGRALVAAYQAAH